MDFRLSAVPESRLKTELQPDLSVLHLFDAATRLLRHKTPADIDPFSNFTKMLRLLGLKARRVSIFRLPQGRCRTQL